MRRLALSIVTVSTLLAAAVAGLWLHSRTVWETAYVRTGGWFWQADSSLGSITLHWYGGWPSPPGYRHDVADHDPTKGVGPVFAVQYAGAGRSKWSIGPSEGEYGTTRVVVCPSGAVQWNTPALPILQALSTARLSPLFRFWSVTLPDWFLVALLMLPLAASGVLQVVSRGVRRSKRSRGLCAKCASNVCGIAGGSGRCPECGHAVALPGGTPAEV